MNDYELMERNYTNVINMVNRIPNPLGAFPVKDIYRLEMSHLPTKQKKIQRDYNITPDTLPYI